MNAPYGNLAPLIARRSALLPEATLPPDLRPPGEQLLHYAPYDLLVDK